MEQLWYIDFPWVGLGVVLGVVITALKLPSHLREVRRQNQENRIRILTEIENMIANSNRWEAIARDYTEDPEVVIAMGKLEEPRNALLGLAEELHNSKIGFYWDKEPDGIEARALRPIATLTTLAATLKRLLEIAAPAMPAFS